ncbi:hypothetical protein FRC20_010767 [Serendipita sp. 405]|nr:hypothetical protein FRC20_010767 [Serendipita sp. 405]
MCDWRTEYDRKQGPKSGGPSNIKNYNSRSYKPGPRSPPPKTEATSRIPGDSNGNLGPKGPTRAPPPPLHIMQNRGIGRGASPTSPSTSSSNSFSTTSPIVSSPQYGSVGSHQAPAAGRGAPAWASRGRGRGRGESS